MGAGYHINGALVKRSTMSVLQRPIKHNRLTSSGSPPYLGVHGRVVGRTVPVDADHPITGETA
jgi:hypothetical protein